MVEISEIENRKKGQKSLIGALRTPKSFFKNFRSKHMGSPEISVGGLLIMILGHFFEKPVLRLTAKNDIVFENSRENLKENFLHLAFFLNFFSLIFVERCISTNSSPIPSKFDLETNTIIDVNLRKIYARALPRACAVAIFSRASSKKCCRKTGFSKNGLKSWSGGLRTKFLAISCVLTESSSKIILRWGASVQ